MGQGLTNERSIMKRLKRIAALAAVILWGILLIATLITAIIDNETCSTLFPGLLFTDIGLPIVIYSMMLIYRILCRKSTTN
jgi:hypothetical protein